MTSGSPLNRERVERAARIYRSNEDAGRALNISPGSFGRLCRSFGILTPQKRRRQEHANLKDRKET